MTQGLMLLTPPAVEPVGLNEAKAYLGVLDSAEDSLISNLITAARQAVEQYCGRVLISQSWRLTLDTWPQEAIVNGGLRDDVALLAANHRLGGGVVEIQLPKPPLVMMFIVMIQLLIRSKNELPHFLVKRLVYLHQLVRWLIN